jgi:alcohol dehydrogenase YqhD (iron-dependent ADH family)
LPIIGEHPDRQTAKFVTGLAEHFKKAHKEQAEGIWNDTRIFATQFAGWIVMQQFQTDDPQLQASQQRLRAWLHRLTIKNQISDADLQDRIARLELAEPDAEKVTALCKELRDYLTEQGQRAL